jgi:hypothetical protein
MSYEYSFEADGLITHGAVNRAPSTTSLQYRMGALFAECALGLVTTQFRVEFDRSMYVVLPHKI